MNEIFIGVKVLFGFILNGLLLFLLLICWKVEKIKLKLINLVFKVMVIIKLKKMYYKIICMNLYYFLKKKMIFFLFLL